MVLCESKIEAQYSNFVTSDLFLVVGEHKYYHYPFFLLLCEHTSMRQPLGCPSRTCSVELVDVGAVTARDESVDDVEREAPSVVYGEV